MEFQVPCECGKELTVSEAAADSRRQCPCGRMVAIPSLKEMRLRAGLPAFNVPPEKLIEHMLATGEVPGDGRCAGCGKQTPQVVHIETECEKSWTSSYDAEGERALKEGFYLSWGDMLQEFFVYWTRALLPWGKREERTYGSDKAYMLPLTMCPECVPAMQGETAIKRCLWTVPVYRQLLDKFPDAKVRLVLGWQPGVGPPTPDK